jgi:hypothetical protein
MPPPLLAALHTTRLRSQAREQAIKDAGCDGEYHEGADYDGQFISRPMVHSAVRTTLEGFKQLSATVSATRAALWCRAVEAVSLTCLVE